MTLFLRFCAIICLFLTQFSFADCSSHFLELNQKILAKKSKDLLATDVDIKQFVKMTSALPSKDRQIFLKRLMELANRDFDLASQMTKGLNQLTESGILTKSNLEEIIVSNSGNKIVFTFDQNQKLNFIINLSSEALENAGLVNDLKWEIINIDLPIEIQRILVSNIQEINSEKNMSLISSALNYMTSLKEEEKIHFVFDFKKILETNPESKIMKRFKKNIKKFNDFEARTKKELIAEFKQKKISDEEAFNRAKAGASEQRRIYENLSYGCKGSSQTVDQQIATKKFIRFKSVMGITTNISMYSYNNWDKEKDFKWFAKLGYEISMSQIMTYVNSKIITNPNSTYVAKALKNYGIYTVSDLITSEIYEKLFGASKKKLEEELKKLESDPEFREGVKKLHEVLDHAKVDQNLINKMNYVFTDKDFDPEKITPEELESPAMKELFLELIAQEMYYENMGGLIQTGSTGLDRFTFSRMYGVVASTKGMAINLIIYNMLCMAGSNPALAYLKVGSIFMVDNIITNYYYYKLRREMINQ